MPDPATACLRLDPSSSQHRTAQRPPDALNRLLCPQARARKNPGGFVQLCPRRPAPSAAPPARSLPKRTRSAVSPPHAYAALMQSSVTPFGMFCSNQVPGIRLVPVWLDTDCIQLMFTFQATVVSPADTAKTHRMAVESPLLVRAWPFRLPSPDPPCHACMLPAGAVKTPTRNLLASMADTTPFPLAIDVPSSLLSSSRAPPFAATCLVRCVSQLLELHRQGSSTDTSLTRTHLCKLSPGHLEGVHFPCHVTANLRA